MTASMAALHPGVLPSGQVILELSDDRAPAFVSRTVSLPLRTPIIAILFTAVPERHAHACRQSLLQIEECAVSACIISQASAVTAGTSYPYSQQRCTENEIEMFMASLSLTGIVFWPCPCEPRGSDAHSGCEAGHPTNRYRRGRHPTGPTPVPVCGYVICWMPMESVLEL